MILFGSNHNCTSWQNPSLVYLRRIFWTFKIHSCRQLQLRKRQPYCRHPQKRLEWWTTISIGRLLSWATVQQPRPKQKQKQKQRTKTLSSCSSSVSLSCCFELSGGEGRLQLDWSLCCFIPSRVMGLPNSRHGMGTNLQLGLAIQDGRLQWIANVDGQQAFLC